MAAEPNPTAFLVKRLEAMRRKGETDSEILARMQEKLGLDNRQLVQVAGVTLRQHYRWKNGVSPVPQTLLLLLDAILMAE